MTHLLKFSFISSIFLCSTISFKVMAEDEALINIGLDKHFNVRVTDRDNKRPERCIKPENTEEHHKKHYGKLYGKPTSDNELQGDNDIVCRIYQKPTRKLDEKTFNVTLHKGSYILTLADDNGSLFQLCYDDRWYRVACAELK